MAIPSHSPASHRALVIRIGLVVLLVAGLALLWKVTPLAAYATPDYIQPRLEEIRAMPLAIPIAMAIYTIGTLAFFPHMAMTATIVLVFSPVQAFAICMTGSLVSGSIGYLAGRLLGMRSLKKLFGETAAKMSHYINRGGLMGVTLLRLLPIAPYTAVNIAFGMLEVPFWLFLGGTFLGTLPGTALASLLGYSALELWREPDLKNSLMVAVGIAGWIGIIVGTHLIHRWWRRRHARG